MGTPSGIDGDGFGRRAPVIAIAQDNAVARELSVFINRGGIMIKSCPHIGSTRAWAQRRSRGQMGL